MKTNIEYHELVLQNLPESYRNRFSEEKKYLQKNIPINSKILDVACGDGRSIYDILNLTNDITWIDYDDKAVKDAKNNFKKNPCVKIIKADAMNLPFDDSSFDIEISMGNFMNFADKKVAILSEMKRVLHKDWKIIISVFSEDALQERLKVYKNIGIKIDKIVWWTVVFDPSVGANISEQFSQPELEFLVQKAWLRIEDIKKVGIAYLCTLLKSDK